MNDRPVSRHLLDLISRQVADHGLVVWFDPERQYACIAEALSISETHVLHYTDSVFALRREADRFMEGGRPRLVVYVPCAEQETEHALVELTAAGVVMKPGAASRQRNTRLSVVARAALHAHLSETELADLGRQIEAGKLTLADLDRLPTAGTTVLSLVFDTGDPGEIALRLLESSRYDDDLARRGVVGDLSALLAGAFGIPDPASTLDGLRAQLARQILATEFVVSLAGGPPAGLAGVGAADGPPRQRCLDVAGRWQRDRGLRESYAEWSSRVAGELGLDSLPLAPEQLWSTETFLRVDTTLQQAVERRLAAPHPLSAEEIARYRDLLSVRLNDFWSSWPERFDEVQPRWQLIAAVLDLLTIADTVETELKGTRAEPAEMLRRYTDPDRPWCLLDTALRRLEQQVHASDLVYRHHSLDEAVNRARWRYMAVGGSLAERFTRALADAKYSLSGALRQVQVYDRHVAPLLGEARVAYVLVDALRFEMAREQADRLAGEYEATLNCAVATAPTLTPAGMASLLPGAIDGITLVPAGSGALAVQIGGKTLATRKDRIDHFQRVHPGAAVATLEDVLSGRNRQLEARLREAPLILVTSQEIDALAEADNVHQAWLLMDGVLSQLGRLINRLRDFGCDAIVVTADHGYLFADEAEADMKIDPPGGRTISLHRRVWLGHGGEANPAYLRAPLSALGVNTDLDLATPWGFAVFRSPGGARAYFHGGLSLPELAVPVLTLRPRGRAGRRPAGAIAWEITPGAKRISTRFCAVTLGGAATELFLDPAPVVRIEIRADGLVIARSVAATYGFDPATGDIALGADAGDARRLESNTVTLEILQIPAAKQASIHLLDAVTARELAEPVTIPVSIQEY